VNDKSNDSFEAQVAAGLEELAAPDPRVIERIQESVGRLPDRGRRSVRSLVALGTMLRLAAVVAVLVLAGGTLLLVVRRPGGLGGPPIGPTESATASALATGLSAPTFDLSPRQFATDPRMLACEKSDGRTLDDVLYAFELAHGKDYRANLQIPLEPALAGAEQPALVVVFKTGDPLNISQPYVPGHSPVAVPPPPDARTVCIGLTGVNQPVVIVNLDKSKIVPPPAPSPSGPIASVFAALNGDLAAMAWDSGRSSLWIVTADAGPIGRLTRVGLDGSTETWALPNGPNLQPLPKIQGGLIVQPMPAAWYGWDATDVVVDGQGELWIAAGYGLVRFDPDTGKSQLRTFAESDATKLYVLKSGHWISAIATDGDGVLIARNGEPTLVRVDETLDASATITLPSNWTGIRGLAVLGDRILAGGPSGLAVFSRTGAQLGEGNTAVQFGSLRPIGSDRAAVLPTTVGDDKATVVDASGAVVGTVAVPMEPVQAYSGLRLVVATDWSDHVWYGRLGDQAVYLVESSVTLPK
jgi:hypothetical protein